MFASEYSPTRSSHTIRYLALIVAMAATAGCAARQSLELPDLGDWEQRRYLLEQIDDWEFSGRIGVVAGDDGFNGSLRWAQDGSSFEATVSGPLGIGTVRLEGDEHRVRLTDNDGNVTALNNAEEDLYLRYGWTIPVRSLRFWALGIPDPAQPAHTEFDGEGSLVTLHQGGWTVAISRYGEGGGQAMPTRLSAENSATKVKLVIHRWSFFDQPSL